MNRPPVNKSKIKKNLLRIVPGNAPKERGRQGGGGSRQEQDEASTERKWCSASLLYIRHSLHAVHLWVYNV